MKIINSIPDLPILQIEKVSQDKSIFLLIIWDSRAALKSSWLHRGIDDVDIKLLMQIIQYIPFKPGKITLSSAKAEIW